MTTLADPKSLDSDVAVRAEPPPRRWRARAWIVGGGLVLLALTARTLLRSTPSDPRRGGEAPRAVSVVTTKARAGDVPVFLRGLGTVTAFKAATVKSRVDGQLLSAAIREGQEVAEGDLLAQIDPRPFEVQVQQAEGQLAKDRAALKDAQVNLDRFQSLYQEQIVPQQQLDTQRAQVDQFAGAIEADEAQVRNARLQLSYSRITAPFRGRIGLRLVDPGNIVHASDPNGLFVLNQVHPIAVVFSLPQDELAEVRDKLRAGASLEVEAYDRDNSRRIADGKLLTVDNQIDTTTGTYRLKAVFENADDALFPNQFVNVRLRLDTLQGLVLVPSAAVQRGSHGTFTYVVGADATAHVRPVKVAITQETDAGISEGLQAGDDVVVEGQDRLQEGSRVEKGGGKPASGEGGGRTRDAGAAGRRK